MPKLFTIFGLAALCLLLGACRTVPAEGAAVKCGDCRTMWIYLGPTTSAPGLYRMKEDTAVARVCPHCQRLALAYFERGILPRRCAQCQGLLQVCGVDIIK